ncbi:MAG: hypothetical protein H6978_00160 [Gammaproteobacteria bacterium]|nr:hypothetical protein [Gammaproteobacteria bacterium]
MKKLSMLLVASALAIPVTAMAQSEPKSAVLMEKGKDGGSIIEAIQLQAKVKSIDMKSRTVILVGPHGNELVFHAGDDVRNLEQVKVGDLVTTTYTQALALELRKVANDGIRQRVDKQKTTRAKQGDKPGIMVEKTIEVVADVVAINRKAQTVTLRGVRRTLELYVKDIAMLDTIKVGDQVEGVYAEATAITVTPAKK